MLMNYQSIKKPKRISDGKIYMVKYTREFEDSQMQLYSLRQSMGDWLFLRDKWRTRLKTPFIVEISKNKEKKFKLPALDIFDVSGDLRDHMRNF